MEEDHTPPHGDAVHAGGAVLSATITPTTITVQVSPEETLELTRAMEAGTIRLALRSPFDDKVIKLPAKTDKE